jgi:hypothetical protein
MAWVQLEKVAGAKKKRQLEAGATVYPSSYCTLKL